MGRTKLKIWLLLLGWLWLQPALAQHPLEADLPGHSHHCLICALHLDGKLALTPGALAPVQPFVAHQPIASEITRVSSLYSPHYSIRAPPLLQRFTV
ncbi:hypothetical protein ACW5XF_18210 [Aeromonas lusitana]|uniref:DUF2607 domain-containing protein n=1 Tax=Aeromonas lusitana TaxID=931529 RepID=A0A2M8HBR2_9GAMM|nr:hypothetical protein [Aeromonas lusitana]PJC94008.1 hypothetical protein CUC44_06420 [Aeromonas lusitana]